MKEIISANLVAVIVAITFVTFGSNEARALTSTGGPTTITAQAMRTELSFRIEREPEGSYLNLQFSLVPPLHSALLIAPDGKRTELTAPDRLRRLQAVQRAHPEQGDLFVMTQALRDPLPGAWRLVLEHDRAQRPFSLTWHAGQHQRFEASIEIPGTNEPMVGVGRPVLLRTTEYGAPAQARSATLTIHAPDQATTTLPMVEARSERPVRFNEPGLRVAIFSPKSAGPHRLAANVRFDASATGTVDRNVTLNTVVRDGAPASVQPIRAEAHGPTGGCWNEVEFSLDWQTDARGLYTLSVVLTGSRGDFPVNGTVEATANSPLTLKAVLPADVARRLPMGEQARARAVEVLFTGKDTRLLKSQTDAPLPFPIDPRRFCH